MIDIGIISILDGLLNATDINQILIFAHNLMCLYFQHLQINHPSANNNRPTTALIAEVCQQTVKYLFYSFGPYPSVVMI